ncbi:MAG: aldehyde ferredoxin oxidoreductase, partial [Thermoprotei archaeon]
MYGYTGKVLSIDLTHEKISTISLKEDTLRKFLGGKGLAVYLLLKYLPLKLDALDPDNVIVLSTGPLTGVLPFSNQLIVASKSPLTGSFAWSRSGGKFPQMIKRSGFDAILIKGRSETPVYLWIDDGEVEFRKAIHLWGKDTYSCSKKLLQETRKEAAISVIGPAGELLVRFASIKNDLYFTAGRGGIGA